MCLKPSICKKIKLQIILKKCFTHPVNHVLKALYGLHHTTLDAQQILKAVASDGPVLRVCHHKVMATGHREVFDLKF